MSITYLVTIVAEPKAGGAPVTVMDEVPIHINEEGQLMVQLGPLMVEVRRDYPSGEYNYSFKIVRES